MMKKTFIFFPPLRKATGGSAVLLRLARALARAGFEIRLAAREPDILPPEARDLDHVPFDRAAPGPGDIWLVPEGWPNALAPGLAAGARCVVYCQNWAYLFNGLPPGTRLTRLPLSYLAVSHPVARFIEEALGRPAPVLHPGIDLDIFSPPGRKPAPSPVRVAYMPRKNKALAAQIMAIADARSERTGVGLEWIALENLDLHGVAEALRGCHVFLATGFPEGCPLPPLEAMACGCLPVGFAGYGGWDYMRQAIPNGAAPSFPLRPVPWGGNGIYAQDNDVLAAALALEEAACWIASGDPRGAAALAAGRETVPHYGLDAQANNAAALWETLLTSGVPDADGSHA